MIAGIVSHGDGCSKKHKPSIYTNVLFFRNWIRSQVKNFVENFCKKRNKRINNS